MSGWERMTSFYTTIRTPNTTGAFKDNRFYLLRPSGGYNNQCYDVATDSWFVITPPPFDPSAGAAAAFGFDGILYVVFGGTQFASYNPATDIWSNLTASPFVGPGASMVNSGGFLYLLKGDGTRKFHRYDISMAVWSQLTDLPIADEAPSQNFESHIEYLSSINKLVATTKHHVLAYDISSQTWDSLTWVPLLFAMGSGGSFVYHTTSDTLYTIRGGGSVDIGHIPASDQWKRGFVRPPMPAPVNIPGKRAFIGITGGRDYLYQLRGDGTASLDRIALSMLNSI